MARAEEFRLKGKTYDLQRQLRIIRGASAGEDDAVAAETRGQAPDTIISPNDKLMVDIVGSGVSFVSCQILVEADGSLTWARWWVGAKSMV